MLSDDEIHDLATSVLEDPRFGSGLDVISDHTRLDEAITTEQLRRLVELFRSRRGTLRGVRWAVVTRRDASFGMMRMLSVHVESVPMAVEVFREFEQAEAWLRAGRGDAQER